MSYTSERRAEKDPFFSICIPQHNRTRFLVAALKAAQLQTFHDFEICISDDCSNDGLQQEVLDFLADSKLYYAYSTTPRNLRYDGNLRASISLARGKFCVLMGNDDCFKDADTLAGLHAALVANPAIGVVIGNFEDWLTGVVTNRIRETKLLPPGPLTAIHSFRNMAFVSGLVVDRHEAQSLATDRWDLSEMYQMYILCRVIAGGRALFNTVESLTRKDLLLPDEEVDRHSNAPRIHPCPITVRERPFNQIGRLVADAVAPFHQPDQAGREAELIFMQLYCFTYPYWIIEYRRIQSWNYSAGICLGIRPRTVVGNTPLGFWRLWRIRLVWALSCSASLITPVKLFDFCRGTLYRISKRI